MNTIEDQVGPSLTDIHAGQVEAVRGADPVCRKAVARMVAGPEPALAVAAECATPSWRGIVRRLWLWTYVWERRPGGKKTARRSDREGRLSVYIYTHLHPICQLLEDGKVG